MHSIRPILTLEKIKENIDFVLHQYKCSYISTDHIGTNIESQDNISAATPIISECIYSLKMHKAEKEDQITKSDPEYKKLTGNLARDYKNVKLADYIATIEFLEKLHKDCERRFDAARSANTALKSEINRQ